MDIREQILEARQKRLEIIRKNFNENYLIVIKCNICGNEKNPVYSNFLREIFLNKVLEVFTVIDFQFFNSVDGNFYLVEIEDKDIALIKRKLIAMENENYGRFIDLDLYTNKEKSVSRKDFHYESRKCFICNREVIQCAREGRHSVDEVNSHIEKTVKTLLVDDIVNFAISAMQEEVSAHPKFGLVTRKSNGKHSDMDYNTFLKSIEAIKPYLYEYATEGFSFNEDSFSRLREIGKRAEKLMFKATNDINTHKGTIFLLGFLLPSLTNVIYNDYDLYHVSIMTKQLAKDIYLDFENKDDMTYGKKAYLSYGVGGIRSEVYQGLPLTFSGLDKFMEIANYGDEEIINILLYVMEHLDDTVILHKKDLRYLKKVKKIAKEINSNGGYSSQEGKKLVKEYTDFFICEGISPGGSADIVITILLMIKVYQKFYK